MRRLRSYLARIGGLFHQQRADHDLTAELESHLQMQIEANLKAGMSREEARRQALIQLGGLDATKEAYRDQRSLPWLENLLQDIRFGLRQLRKHPTFTAVALLTLAIGIGANTTIFSIIHGILLKPLPYPEPYQLVTLWERDPSRGVEQDRVSGPNYLDWRAQNSVFSEMAVSPAWQGSDNFNLVLRDSITKVRATHVSATMFTTLGTKPLIGRTLLPEEDVEEGPRNAVISHGLWQRIYAGDPDVIGQTLTMDTYGRRDYTIVGVMPAGFGTPNPYDVWLPLGWMDVSLTERRSAHWHHVVARLKPDVSLAKARAELNLIQNRLKAAFPGETIGSEVSIVPLLQQALGRNLHRALWVLWCVVGLVLLIACANVANLMLARAASRQKEIALRMALGASRGRIMRQLLVESIVLSTAGGMLGILLAWAGIQLFISTSPADIPRLDEVSLSYPALIFTVAISIVTGIVFGLAPAWQASRPDLNTALNEGTRGGSSGLITNHTRSLLIVSEVALSLVLLIGAGLMLQSFQRMLHAERGFRPERLMTAELDFSVSGFTTWVQPTATRPQVPLHELMERLRATPGVQTVGAGSSLLRQENRPPNNTISIFGQPVMKPENRPQADFKGITPDWLQTLGARILRGRDFSETDTLAAPSVVLVNETLARRYFADKDPIGQRLRMGHEQPPLNATNRWGQSEWSTIVGVVSDVTSLHPQPEVVPEVFVPYWQWPMQSPTLLIRTTNSPAMLAEVIRREAKAVLPNLPAPVIQTMDHHLSDTLAQPRLQTILLSLFAGIALILAAIGLYGVLAYLVTLRTREIGIRQALGAQKHAVIGMMIGQGMKLVLLGVLIGLLCAKAVTRVLGSLLYEVNPADTFTFTVVSLLLIVVALAACWLPARRAARIQPMEALRYE